MGTKPVAPNEHSGAGQPPAPSPTFMGEAIYAMFIKLQAIDRGLDELQGLINLQREHVYRKLDSITQLTREQVAERLCISTSKVDRETKKGALACIKIGRNPRYSVEDIQLYLQSRRHPAKGESAHRRQSPKPLELSPNEPR